MSVREDILARVRRNRPAVGGPQTTGSGRCRCGGGARGSGCSGERLCVIYRGRTEGQPLAYLAQHLVVLLDEGAIVPGLQEGYTHPVFRSARYAVFHTGPSATADIEGVLIHGAQGVRSLTVIADG
jgi:hypothetical protein